METLRDLAGVTARWTQGEISDAAYASLYFLHWQIASQGRRFASRRFRADPKPDPQHWLAHLSAAAPVQLHDRLLCYFERYQFFGVIGNVPAALAAWLRGEWRLNLCGYIPTSRQVLAMQVDGTRPVTVLSAWPRMLQPVLSKANAFEFMVHDLEHAWKFCHDAELHQQQRAFFQLLQTALEQGRFDEYLRDSQFAAKFDYLSSDMNTHTLHASQYLRAILVEYHLRYAQVSQPPQLPLASQQAIAALMTALFGTAWAEQVQQRMVRP